MNDYFMDDFFDEDINFIIDEEVDDFVASAINAPTSYTISISGSVNIFLLFI